MSARGRSAARAGWLEAMRALCSDITVQLVLGVRDPHRRHQLAAAIWQMLNTPGNPPLPGDHDGPGGVVGGLAERLFQRRSADVRRLLQDELSERHARENPGEDVLGAIISSPSPPADEEIVDQLLIVLMAAQEPPAIALTNVVDELAASSLLHHRDPHAFPDPDAFRAERIMSDVPDDAPCFPFGGGARRCLGEHLAKAEFRTVLPAAFSRLRSTRAWPREERMVVRATVLVPYRSALVKADIR